MKKILFLMFFLTSFLFSEKKHCLYVTSQVTPFCATEISYHTSIGQWAYKINNTSSGFTFSALKNPTISTGYSFDTITNTFEIDPIYNQIDVSDLVSQPEILKDYIDNPPLKNPEPTEPEPTEPEPTEPEPTEPTPTEPTPTEPTPIVPDENGLIMGLTPNDFHFSMALWGIVLAFLISFGLIKSI